VAPAPPAARRVDLGRVVVVALAGVALVAVLARAWRGLGALGTPTGAAAWCGELLNGGFYLLMIRAYLGRGQAVASNRSLLPNVAAVVGTVLPMVFVFLHPRDGGAVRHSVADLLLIGGLLWSLWSLRTLGRSLSLIAQARTLVEAGPYRWIRHPLYTGEIVSTVGIALSVGTFPAFALVLLLIVLQLYRAICEESVLRASFPEYRAYCERTSRIVPGFL
jgi:protein-S-isoprenylcysteine O-methyltransferase Ste14